MLRAEDFEEKIQLAFTIVSNFNKISANLNEILGIHVLTFLVL